MGAVLKRDPAAGTRNGDKHSKKKMATNAQALIDACTHARAKSWNVPACPAGTHDTTVRRARTDQKGNGRLYRPQASAATARTDVRVRRCRPSRRRNESASTHASTGRDDDERHRPHKRKRPAGHVGVVGAACARTLTAGRPPDRIGSSVLRLRVGALRRSRLRFDLRALGKGRECGRGTPGV